MKNEELKKKIIEIVLDTEITGIKIRNITGGISMAKTIADALIAAGMGDVKEEKFESDHYWSMWQGSLVELERAEHRAEVAERALRNAAPRLKCRGGLGEGFCGVDKCDYYHCNNDEGCVKAHLQQAEKELAEERKDD